MPQVNQLRPFLFVLAVQDPERNTTYFRDALGFKAEWLEGTGWQLLSRGDVRNMIGHCPDAVSPYVISDHSYFGYLHVDDDDALHEELGHRGALIAEPPADKPCGMCESW